MSTTSQVLVDRYLKGRKLLLKSPYSRSCEERSFLQTWLLSNVPLFEHMDSGELTTELDSSLWTHCTIVLN